MLFPPPGPLPCAACEQLLSFLQGFLELSHLPEGLPGCPPTYPPLWPVGCHCLCSVYPHQAARKLCLSPLACQGLGTRSAERTVTSFFPMQTCTRESPPRHVTLPCGSPSASSPDPSGSLPHLLPRPSLCPHPASCPQAPQAPAAGHCSRTWPAALWSGR